MRKEEVVKILVEKIRVHEKCTGIHKAELPNGMVLQYGCLDHLIYDLSKEFPELRKLLNR